MAPPSRGAWLSRLAAVAALAAAVATPTCGRAWWIPASRRPACGDCGKTTWTGRCVPLPRACGGQFDAVCVARTGDQAAAADGGPAWLPAVRPTAAVVFECQRCVPPPPVDVAAVARGYKAAIARVYEPLTQPPAVPIGMVVAGQPPPGTFASTAGGRIAPLGTFDSLDDTLEYFLGIIPSVGMRAVNATVSQFFASPPYAYATVDVLVRYTPTGAVGRASHVGAWRFNEAGLITAYDLSFVGITELLAGFGFDFASREQVESVLIPRLCSSIMTLCTGDHVQYASAAACVDFLRTLPAKDFSAGNIAACRQLHLPLTNFRPEIHCAHVGRSGGGKCVDRPFDDRYEDNTRILDYPWLVPSPSSDPAGA